MDWSLLIFAVVVMFYGYQGYRRGLLKSLSRVLSLSAGYAAAVFYSTHFSTIIASIMPVQGFATLIVAFVILFFGAGIIVNILFLVLELLIPELDLDSPASSYAGAGIGLLSGLVIAIITTWTLAYTRDTQPPATAEAITSTQSSDIEILANQLAGKTVSTAMSLGSAQPVLTGFSVALAENPAEVTMQAQRLANSHELNRLLNVVEHQVPLSTGDIEAIEKLDAFQQLTMNPDFIALARSTEMVTEPYTNSESVTTILAKYIVDIWGHIQQTIKNQRAQEIINNPEFQQEIQSGDPVQLLTNANLLELTNMLFAAVQNPGVELN